MVAIAGGVVSVVQFHRQAVLQRLPHQAAHHGERMAVERALASGGLPPALLRRLAVLSAMLSQSPAQYRVSEPT
ncbi:MAG TPA: hypothetical protein VEC60_00835 [Reyranella sp.]|nr:hypothetical protein [Reyranella sp.]